VSHPRGERSVLRSVASKVAWVGRTASMVFGLALVLALVLGVSSAALAALPGDPFKLGQINRVDRLTTLASTLVGPVLRVDNDGSGSALDLRVGDPAAAPTTKIVAPMKVDSQGRVTNLNSDELDGKSASEFLPAGGKAADADKFDGLDSTQFMGDFAGRNDAFTSEFNSAQFKTVSVQCLGTGKVVDGYAQVYPNTAESPIPVALQTVGSIGDNIWKATASEMVPYEGNWGISVNVLCVKSPPGS
jgi:hypothetical protein